MFRKVLNDFQHLSLTPVLGCGRNLLESSFQGIVQKRTTFILKRKYPVKLLKKGRETPPRYKAKNYIYDLVEDTNVKKKPDVQVVLTSYVEGLGNSGDCVTVSRNLAYNKLLLPGLAEYATPENIQKAKKGNEGLENKEHYSSPVARQTMKFLEAQVLAVVMNKENDWVLKPWHIRVAFRKAGINVPEKSIEIPEQEIRGPDLNLELKDFVVTVTINNREKVSVRCRLHHWSTNPGDRLPYVKYPWSVESEAIFKEQTSTLAKLPLPKFEPPPQMP